MFERMEQQVDDAAERGLKKGLDRGLALARKQTQAQKRWEFGRSAVLLSLSGGSNSRCPCRTEPTTPIDESLLHQPGRLPIAVRGHVAVALLIEHIH